MSKDKRFSCEKIPTWHEGVFYRLLKDGNGCKLVLCDNDGDALLNGNVLSITQDGVVVRHSGVTDAEELVKINPDNGKIYTNEEYVEHRRNAEMQRMVERQRFREQQMPRRASSPLEPDTERAATFSFEELLTPEWVVNTITGDET